MSEYFALATGHLSLRRWFYSWIRIRQTANVTDAQLIAKYRHTALYAAVMDALDSEGELDANLLTPEQAAILPTREELTSRWPGHSTEQIEDLIRDYETEDRRLQSLDLEYVFDRVKELAVENAQ